MGIGYDFSLIRPNGTPTSNDAVASGVVSFMDVFNAQTATIMQGSRRGANMGVLNIYHMDINEYINAKSTDGKRLEHFNMSVMVDDDFMIAVENDSEINLRFPVYDDKYKIIKDESRWSHKKTIKARELWDKVMTTAYNTGEIGVLFYDNMNKDNNTWYTETITHTNPCFAGDMRLLTSEGYQTFESLEDKEVNIVSYDGTVSRGKVWCSGVKDTVEVNFANGTKIKCTPDHIFMLEDGSECEAKDLKGKRVKFHNQSGVVFDKNYVAYGFIQGDGNLTRLSSSAHKGIEVNIGKKDEDVMWLFEGDEYSRSERTIYLSGYNEDLKKLGFSDQTLPYRKFPTTYNDWSKNQKLSFLIGCFSANGCVVKGNRIQYKTTSIDFANELCSALKEFEINTNITINKEKENRFKNGTYICKESYDVCINQFDSIVRFNYLIGFLHNYKNKSLLGLIKDRTPKVLSVKKSTTEKVYDFNEPNNHWGVVEGVVVHNCGEYLAGTVFGQELDSSQYGGSCNLGSVFLHYLVKNPFTDKAYLDMDLLKKAVYDGVEFLDNVIDVNNFPSPIYENYQKNFRTIGLGITGLANAMAMLNIKYGSMKSHNFVKKLMNDIAKFAYTKSIDMAVEKGSFPFLDREKFIQSGFIQKHVDSDAEWGTIAKEIVKYGIRNARILSVAPTGTLSLTFGNNCSSGIEPTFSLEYDRKVKIGGQDESDIQIIKMQDYAYGLWKETTVDNIVNEEIFVTAMNLDVSSHIEILEIVAFHTDMSVSKTVNIPTEYSFEKTKEVYTDCWKSGIKGCTIFRPNEIRQGILISENSTPKEKPISTNTSTELKRGDIICVSDDLLSFKRTIVNGCGKFYIHCDFDEYSGEPLETFIEVGSGGTCERNIQFISRLISLLLRAGVPIEEIVDQARSIRPCKAYTDRTRTKGDTSKGVSCPSAIGHALTDLKNKINERVFNDYEIESFLTHEDTEHKCNGKCDGSCDTVPQITSKDICPECGNTLRNEGGCVICLGGETGGCGWTKCD